MNAQKRIAETKNCELTLVASESRRRIEPRKLLSRLVELFTAESSDLTFQNWEALEAKPKAARAVPAPLRDQYYHQMRWHL